MKIQLTCSDVKGKFVTALFSLVLVLVSAQAQTTWTGESSSDFTDGGNWSDGAPLDQDVLIDTSSGLLSISLASPTPNPYSINNLTVSGNNALTFDQTSGTLSLTLGPIDFGTSGSSYDLTGGTLQVGGTDGITGTGTLNLGGGTLQTINSDLSVGSGVNVALAANTYSIIDTNGFGTTFNGSVTGASGGLAKIGAGDLALNNASNTIGSFLVAGGNVNQSTGTLTTSELAVGTGASNTASYTMSGGSIVFSSSAPPPIVGGTASTFRVGDFGGTGTFTQTAGSVSLDGSLDIGNEGGNGTYNISGGALNLGGGLVSLGRTTATYSAPASTGALNISGTGVVTVSDHNFVIGDRDATGNQGVGTVTQTGGTFTVDNAAGLFLGGYGTGNVYNLNGGTLQIGGTSLQGLYGQTGTYQFNLGGGTIQVLDSDLTTSVDATLVGSTTSILDTNGFDATWSGALTGSGTLSKIGAGNLTLNGTNNVGEIDVQQGSATNGNGTTTTTGLYVGYNQLGANGTLNVTGGTINVQGSSSNDGFTVGAGTGSTGDATISGGVINVGDSSTYGHFFVGTFGGVGTVEQSGGTVNVTGPFEIGNRGGTGTYTLSNGILDVGVFPAANDSNALIIARSRTSDTAATSGTLNVSGGHLILETNTPLLIGGDGNASSGSGTGVVNQTGGTVTVNSWIDLGSPNSSGTYNLNGGTLQIGGTDGIQNTAGTGAFNFGGGTLQVIANDLTTSVQTALVSSTTSTIDTNGFNAILNGTITGSGNLIKVGAGTLTTSDIDSSGEFDLQGGTWVSSGASSAIEQLSVEGGAFTAETNLTVGNTGVGTYNMTGGMATFENGLAVGNSSGSTGTVNQTGGTVSLTGGSLDLKQSTSAYNLYGGTLQVGGGGVTGSGSLNVGSGDLNTSLGTINGTGGTLAGNGSVHVATVVSNNGVVAPGSTVSNVHTPGQLTFSDLTLNTGSTFSWNLASETTLGTGINFDQINAAANGSIVLSGNLILSLSFSAGTDFSDSFWSSSETWDIIDATASGASLSDSAIFAITSSSSSSYASNGSFSASQVGNQVQLTWTPQPVPEPSSPILVTLGVILFTLVFGQKSGTYTIKRITYASRIHAIYWKEKLKSSVILPL